MFLKKYLFKNPLTKFILVLFLFSNKPFQAQTVLDGIYKSEFIMKMNRIVTQGAYRCPREVPIKIVLKVNGNEITGSINNTHEKCDNWQNATIKGSIDNEGNFIKTKFFHEILPWGRLEDAYKIEGNILGEMTLKSKSRMFWKDKIFTFSKNESSDPIKQKETSRKNKNSSKETKNEDTMIKRNIKGGIESNELDYKEESLIKLKSMLERGLITEKEYKKLRLKTLGL